MGNTVGGDLKTALLVDACTFGAFGLVVLFWTLTTRRSCIRGMLWSFLTALFFRVIIPLGLLWNVSATDRDDGVQVVWLRWAVYIAIYALALSFGYTEYLCFQSARHAWTVAMALAATMVGPLAVSLSDTEEKRILWISLSAVPFLFANACLWWYRRPKIHVDPEHSSMPWNHVIMLLVVELAWIGGAVLFILGHAFTRHINYVQETWGFYGVDIALYVLVAIWCLFLHCGCPCESAPNPTGKDKKDSGVYMPMTGGASVQM